MTVSRLNTPRTCDYARDRCPPLPDFGHAPVAGYLQTLSGARRHPAFLRRKSRRDYFAPHVGPSARTGDQFLELADGAGIFVGGQIKVAIAAEIFETLGI